MTTTDQDVAMLQNVNIEHPIARVAYGKPIVRLVIGISWPSNQNGARLNLNCKLD